jgi:hypothetical protein
MLFQEQLREIYLLEPLLMNLRIFLCTVEYSVHCTLSGTQRIA